MFDREKKKEMAEFQGDKSNEKRHPNKTGIPDTLKKSFERGTGLSLSDVRIKYNSAAPAAFRALAYTYGNQVHIAPGQERYLTHELGHVIQQKRGVVKPTGYVNGLPVNTDSTLESLADTSFNKAHASHSAANPGNAVYQFMSLAVKGGYGGTHFVGSEYRIERHKRDGWKLCQILYRSYDPSNPEKFKEFKKDLYDGKFDVDQGPFSSYPQVNALVASIGRSAVMECDSFASLEKLGDYSRVDYSLDETRLYAGADSYKTSVLNRLGLAVSTIVNSKGLNCGPHVALSFVGKTLYAAINTPNTSQVGLLIKGPQLLSFIGEGINLCIKELTESVEKAKAGAPLPVPKLGYEKLTLELGYMNLIQQSLNEGGLVIIEASSVPSTRDEHLGTTHAEMLIAEHMKSSLDPSKTRMPTNAYRLHYESHQAGTGGGGEPVRTPVLLPSRLETIRTKTLLRRRSGKVAGHGKRVIRFGGTLSDCKLCHLEFHGMETLKSKTKKVKKELPSARGSHLHLGGSLITELPDEITYDDFFKDYDSLVLSSSNVGGWHPGWTLSDLSMEGDKSTQARKEQRAEQRQILAEKYILSEIRELTQLYISSPGIEIARRILDLASSPMIKTDNQEEFVKCIDALIEHISQDVTKALGETGKPSKSTMDRAFELFEILLNARGIKDLTTKLSKVRTFVNGTITLIMQTGDIPYAIRAIKILLRSTNFSFFADEGSPAHQLVFKAAQTAGGIAKDMAQYLSILKTLLYSPHLPAVMKLVPDILGTILKTAKSISSSGNMVMVRLISLALSVPVPMNGSILADINEIISKTATQIIEMRDVGAASALMSVITFFQSKNKLSKATTPITGIIKAFVILTTESARHKKPEEAEKTEKKEKDGESRDTGDIINFIDIILNQEDRELINELGANLNDLMATAVNRVIEDGNVSLSEELLETLVCSPYPKDLLPLVHQLMSHVCGGIVKSGDMKQLLNFMDMLLGSNYFSANTNPETIKFFAETLVAPAIRIIIERRDLIGGTKLLDILSRSEYAEVTKILTESGALTALISYCVNGIKSFGDWALASQLLEILLSMKLPLPGDTTVLFQMVMSSLLDKANLNGIFELIRICCDPQNTREALLWPYMEPIMAAVTGTGEYAAKVELIEAFSYADRSLPPTISALAVNLLKSCTDPNLTIRLIGAILRTCEDLSPLAKGIGGLMEMLVSAKVFAINHKLLSVLMRSRNPKHTYAVFGAHIDSLIRMELVRIYDGKSKAEIDNLLEEQLKNFGYK